MAPQSSDVARLLTAAAHATTYPEQQRLIGEAEEARTTINRAAAADRQLDLAQAVVAERLTPVRVHEHHTAATDWMGELDTAPPAGAVMEIVAQGSVWYSKLPEMVKQHPDELAQQALGMGRRLAGRFGTGADEAERAFLDHVGELHRREVTAGLVTLAAMDTHDPAVLEGQATENGLPGELTSSERAPAMQDMQNNTAGGSVSDTEWPDPLQLPQADVDSINGDSGTAQDHAKTAIKAPYYSEDAGTGPPRSRDLTGTPFSRELGQSVFGPHDDAAVQGWRDQAPVLNDHGRHLYQVTTHHVGPDGSKVKNTREMRSHRPDAHDDVEQAAWEDHASQHGMDPSDVHVGPAMRMDRSGPVGRGTKTYTANREGTQMPQQHTAACPECSGCQACGGTHRVAVRTRTAASGLDQIDQVKDAKDDPKSTPYPEDVAFPWEMPDDSGQAISETEQQLAQREQLKGASFSRRDVAAHAAKRAAEAAYMRVMAGQDDSGWAGDMGAGGVRPGMQDSGNPGSTYPGSLEYADPVYGQGGDNGNQPLKPYGADEADDFTNNPGQNIQPGAPLQADMGGRVNQVGASRRSDGDPQIARALAFVRQRREILDGAR